MAVFEALRRNRKRIGWVAYLLALIAFKLGVGAAAAVFFLLGVLAHLPMWMLGIGAFLIGWHWR